MTSGDTVFAGDELRIDLILSVVDVEGHAGAALVAGEGLLEPLAQSLIDLLQRQVDDEFPDHRLTDIGQKGDGADLGAASVDFQDFIVLIPDIPEPRGDVDPHQQELVRTEIAADRLIVLVEEGKCR